MIIHLLIWISCRYSDNNWCQVFCHICKDTGIQQQEQNTGLPVFYKAWAGHWMWWWLHQASLWIREPEEIWWRHSIQVWILLNSFHIIYTPCLFSETWIKYLFVVLHKISSCSSCPFCYIALWKKVNWIDHLVGLHVWLRFKPWFCKARITCFSFMKTCFSFIMNTQQF